MRHGGTGRRWLCILGAGILIVLIGAPDALAGEWESMRESYDNKLRTHAKRIAEIEARDRGAEREKLRESIASVQKNLETTNASLARVIEDAETTTTRVPRSGVLDKVARIQAAEKERTRWLREQAALERERQQRERSAAERERGVR